jgi:hypothetical protein
MTDLKNLPKVHVVCISDLGSFNYKFEEVESGAEVDLKLSVWLRKDNEEKGTTALLPQPGKAYWVKVNQNWVTFIEPAELADKPAAKAAPTKPVATIPKPTTLTSDKYTKEKAADVESKTTAAAQPPGPNDNKSFDELCQDRIKLPNLKNTVDRKEFDIMILNANNTAATLMQPIIGHMAADAGVDSKVILNLFLELRDGLANDYMTRFFK